MNKQTTATAPRTDESGKREKPEPLAIQMLKASIAPLPYEEQMEAVSPPTPVQLSLVDNVSEVQLTPGSGSTPSPAPSPTPAPPINAATREADVKNYCSGDPIAAQKLADVDAEQYLEDVAPDAAKQGFYTRVGDYINSNHTSLSAGAIYNAIFNTAAQPYRFKGKKLPAAGITGLCTRTSSVNGFWRFQVNQASFLSQAATELGLPDSSEEVKQLAYAKWIAACQSGGDLMPYVNAGASIAPVGFPAWFTPDKVRVDADPNTAYQDLMNIFALQPEWFPEGNVVFEIQPSEIRGEIRKPTAYDGMQSALWVARNQPGESYGMTGGGAREFVANNIPMSAIRSLKGVVPSSDFLAQITALQSRVVGAFLNANPALKTELENLENQVKTLPDGPDKVAAQNRIKEIRGWVPNLTDWVLRGQTTQLTSHIGVKIRDAKAMVQNIAASTTGERASPTPSRSTPVVVNP